MPMNELKRSTLEAARRGPANVVFIPKPIPSGNLAPFICCAAWLTRRVNDEVIPAGTCLGIHYAQHKPIAMCPACNQFLKYIRGENVESNPRHL